MPAMRIIWSISAFGDEWMLIPPIGVRAEVKLRAHPLEDAAYLFDDLADAWRKLAVWR